MTERWGNFTQDGVIETPRVVYICNNCGHTTDDPLIKICFACQTGNYVEATQYVIDSLSKYLTPHLLKQDFKTELKQMIKESLDRPTLYFASLDERERASTFIGLPVLVSEKVPPGEIWITGPVDVDDFNIQEDIQDIKCTFSVDIKRKIRYE